jgi:sugar O-acyltransferase (sialic acid O-acetyltransferase NeuD family)
MNGQTILAGGGGFCRELYFWVGECHAAGRLPPIGGYLDDAGPTLASLDYADMPWLGGVRDYIPRNGDLFFVSVGAPAIKRRVQGILSERSAHFGQLIHPTSRVLRTATLGEGVIFCPGAAAGPDTFIGRFVTFNAVCGAGHDAKVGDFSTISSNVDITGNVEIGQDVMIGSGATFVPGVRVGDGAVIGAGAIVYRSVPAGATVFAPAAKMIRARG